MIDSGSLCRPWCGAILLKSYISSPSLHVDGKYRLGKKIGSDIPWCGAIYMV
jgi:hypothetical protein